MKIGFHLKAITVLNTILEGATKCVIIATIPTIKVSYQFFLEKNGYNYFILHNNYVLLVTHTVQ